MSTFTPTEEQLNIVHSTEQRIKVQAFAGASKTTTCDLYARHRPNVKITYLAFNKATAEEAKQRFPSNVRCVTTHGLCYSQFGAPYRSKLGNARATAVSRALGIGFVQAGRAIETVNNFLTSADKTLSARHAPISVDSREHGLLIDSSIKLWEFMQDTANHDIHMPHDGYLKLFQLTNPTINSDIVITDEAQDLNPVTCSIVNSHDKGLVVVGDDHQAIYQFRNSVNALANVEADATYRLTQSFRFGPGIAALASQMLLSWKDEKVPLIGRGKHQSVFQVNTAEPHAILARTNAGLFSEAVQVYQAGLPFHFWGGADGYKLDVILNAYHLFAEDYSSITDKYIRDFKSFPQMKEYGERMEDNEIRHLVKTVETYTDAIPELIAGLKRKNRPNPTGEEIVFTTAHKSKGAEWDAVRLLDDFPPLEAFFNTKRGQLEQPKVEDITCFM